MNRFICCCLVLFLGLNSSCKRWTDSYHDAKREAKEKDVAPMAFTATEDLESYLMYEDGDSWDTRGWEQMRIALLEEEERLRSEQQAEREGNCSARARIRRTKRSYGITRLLYSK